MERCEYNFRIKICVNNSKIILRLGFRSKRLLSAGRKRHGCLLGACKAHNNRTARSVTRSTTSSDRSVQGERPSRWQRMKSNPPASSMRDRRYAPRSSSSRISPSLRFSLGRSSNQPQPATPSRKCVDELPQILRIPHNDVYIII